MQLRCLLAAALVALAACAALEPRAPQPTAVDSIVAEAVQAARAPAAEQKTSLASAQRAFVAEGSAVNRLRLATLLATLPEPLRDDARAGELLQPISDLRAPGIGGFAAWLAAQLAERGRAAREAERVAREHERSDKERDKREEALRQQVEALRAIEKGIQEREERLRRRGN